jgi:hypothetical protein
VDQPPVTDLSVLTGLSSLTALEFGDVQDDIDLSELESQASLRRLSLLGTPSPKSFEGLGRLPMVETLYFSSLTDLRPVCLPTALRHLGVLSVDASLDLTCIRHDRISWLGLVMRAVCVPRGLEAPTGLPQLQRLYLGGVDIAAG